MRAIFLDRDGIINRRIVDDYVKNWEAFEFLPDIFEVLPQIHAAGYLAIVITNQRGIGRKLMSEESLSEIHERMQQMLAERTGHRFDAIYHCPHDSAEGCDCRKPLPGMITRAATEHDLELDRSWMIGDSESDIDAGRAAGCRTVKVDPDLAPTSAEYTAMQLGEAWEYVGRNDE